MYKIEGNKLKNEEAEIATIGHVHTLEAQSFVKNMNLLNNLSDLLTGEINGATFELSAEQGNLTHLVWKVNGEVEFKMPLVDQESYDATVIEMLRKIIKMYVAR